MKDLKDVGYPREISSGKNKTITVQFLVKIIFQGCAYQVATAHENLGEICSEECLWKYFGPLGGSTFRGRWVTRSNENM